MLAIEFSPDPHSGPDALPRFLGGSVPEPRVVNSPSEAMHFSDAHQAQEAWVSIWKEHPGFAAAAGGMMTEGRGNWRIVELWKGKP